MKQKTFSARLFSLLFSLFFLIPGPAKAAAPSASLRGPVLDVMEDGILLMDPDLGAVILHIDAETVMEGVLAERPLEAGLYVIAAYNGQTTRSLPPMAHAQRLGCYSLEGIAAAVTQSSFLLTGDPLFGDVVVHLSDNLPPVYPGALVTVYYNGAMTLSFPGQVTASHLSVPILKGKVSKLTGQTLAVSGANGEAYSVLIAEETLLPSGLSAADMRGHEVAVFWSGEMTEGTLTAFEIIDLSALPEGIIPAYLQEPMALIDVIANKPQNKLSRNEKSIEKRRYHQSA